MTGSDTGDTSETATGDGTGTGGSDTGSSDTGAEEELCADEDNDGFGDPDNCAAPDDAEVGWVDNDDDCDDTNAQTYPGAAEQEPLLCANDDDEDGWGDDDPPAGVDPGTDCDDANGNAHPGAAEQQPELCAEDEDDDGWGDHDPPTGVDPGGDCDDTDPAVNPPDGDTDCLDPLQLTVTKNFNIDAGDSTTLEAVATGGTGTYTWQWQPAATLDDDEIRTPMATPATSTTYEVTVTDAGTGAVVSDTVTVHVVDTPILLDECAVRTLGPDIDELVDDAWEYEDGDTSACQRENSDAGVLLCDIELDDASVSGSMHVESLPPGPEPTDDDWFGLVWGAVDDGPFYLFTWKAGAQQHAGCGTTNFTAGMRVKLVDSWDGLGCGDLTADSNTTLSELLAGPTDIAEGTTVWDPDVDYSFELDHAPTGSRLTISGSDGFDTEITISDTSLPNGEFGYFSFSQANSCWGGVETEANP
ncbi:MAG: hypothetical protein B7733_20565 [Myxococcales bacterium FL481]|nr:MAG: hypothetical protein B7733_20565 [Myxococcales bacterium FL481]